VRVGVGVGADRRKMWWYKYVIAIAISGTEALGEMQLLMGL